MISKIVKIQQKCELLKKFILFEGVNVRRNIAKRSN